MKIVYFGNGVRGERCLETLLAQSEDVIAVVAHPDKDSSVARLARERKLLVYQPEKVNAPNFTEEIKQLSPDLCILAGYNRILKGELLSLPPKGTINLHGGKLPEYRGVAPINWQIINGETKGGCSILYVDDGIDTGDVIAREYYDITPDDNAATVLEKSLEIFPGLLMETLKKIRSGNVVRIPQNPAEGSYYTRRYPQDGRIEWKAMTAYQAHNLVRALVRPYPGAFTYRDKTKIMVWKSSLLKEEIKGIPGRVPLKFERGIVVIAKDRGLLIEEISIEDSCETIAPEKYFRLGDTLC